MGKVIVSFFNELDTGKELCSKLWVESQDLCFIFLTSLLHRGKTMLLVFVSFFNELATEKRNYARDLFLIMASKRITL
jgi:hypothetical protein